MKSRRIPVSHLFPSGGIVMVEKTRTDTRTPPVAPNFLIQVALSKDENISYDLNSNDADPSPRPTSPAKNVHGTRCAGEIAMVANNGKCGVGIAFRAKIGGIRMLDGVATDRVEGESLKFKHYWVDIYSNSWGPSDDGKTLDYLGHLVMQAMVDGISEVTTDVNNGCTQFHTGTSAAAPLVAGILALLLEANSELTWRDVQHLIIWTSEVAPLEDNYGWYENGFGFMVSHDFGFGMINAFALITEARTWKNVPLSSVCVVPVEVGTNEKAASRGTGPALERKDNERAASTHFDHELPPRSCEPAKYFDKTIDELSPHEKAPRSYEPLTLKEDSEGAINKPPPYFEHQLVPRSYEPPEDTFKPSPHLRESISKLPPHEKQDPSSYQPFKLWEEYENPEEYESSSHYQPVRNFEKTID
ncbi:hypothetical protein M8J75_006119 [Diaphorina citri]|nr:hypothetical protein M8J75_006119 [Diaphorina citri]